MGNLTFVEKVGFYSLLATLLGLIFTLLSIIVGIVNPEVRTYMGLPPVEKVSAEPKPSSYAAVEPTPETIPETKPVSKVVAPKVAPAIEEHAEIINPVFVKRINFAHNTYGTTIRGAIGQDSEHEFLLRARSEQVMNISVSAGNVRFCVYGPGEKSLSKIGGADWSGTLPESGDYRLKVLGNGNNGQYELKISIH